MAWDMTQFSSDGADSHLQWHYFSAASRTSVTEEELLRPQYTSMF
jgi:hypothetical protein